MSRTRTKLLPTPLLFAPKFLILTMLALCWHLIPTLGHATTAKPVITKPVTAKPQHKKKASKRTHTIKWKDYYSLSYVGHLAVSPKGKYVVYGEYRWQKKPSGINQNLWIVNTTTLSRTRLTFSRSSDRHPHWSPDGRWIYFASRRAKHKGAPHLGKTQVWRIRPNGDRLMAVTRSSKSVSSFQLSKDGKSIYYKTSRRRVQKGPFRKLRKRFGKVKYGHSVVRSSRLWKLDLVSWHTTQLLDSKRVISYFDVSSDEKKIALLTTPTNKLISNEGWSRLEIFDIATKQTLIPNDAKWRKKAPSPYGWLSDPKWSPDGQQLAFKIGFDGYPGEIFVLGFAKQKVTSTTKLKRYKEIHYEGTMAWQPGTHRLCFVATRHALNRIYCKTINQAKQGQTEVITTGPQNVRRFTFGRDGQHIAISFAGRTFLSDLFFGKPLANQTKWKRLTKVNPQIDTWKLPTIRKVRWKSKDGTFVEGLLELPPNTKPGKALPLVVILHGGPTWSVKKRLRFSYQGRTLFASKGWATLSPNYRGSTGYGDKFMIDLIGHKNDRDIKDILSGVDALVAKGIVDPKRMAIMGWSNGGYLVNCLITQTKRFKAASSGAGVFDTAMQWMIEDTPGHVINYNRGLPWQKPKSMAKSSPLYNIHKARTPTIIHVGERDPRVPVQHSRALYRALKWYLKVPTQLLIYPKTSHGLHRRRDRTAKMLWDVQWFEYYVLGKGKKKKTKDKKNKTASKVSKKPTPSVQK